jgi:hypothetical protein
MSGGRVIETLLLASEGNFLSLDRREIGPDANEHLKGF